MSPQREPDCQSPTLPARLSRAESFCLIRSGRASVGWGRNVGSDIRAGCGTGARRRDAVAPERVSDRAGAGPHPARVAIARRGARLGGFGAPRDETAMAPLPTRLQSSLALLPELPRRGPRVGGRSNPVRRRRLDVDHSAGTQLHAQEGEQRPKEEIRRRQEVTRPHLVGMIAQRGDPSPTRGSLWPRPRAYFWIARLLAQSLATRSVR